MPPKNSTPKPEAEAARAEVEAVEADVPAPKAETKAAKKPAVESPVAVGWEEDGFRLITVAVPDDVRRPTENTTEVALAIEGVVKGRPVGNVDAIFRVVERAETWAII